MRKKVELNKLINQPYLTREDFDSMTLNSIREKKFYCYHNPNDPTEQLGFLLLKLFYGSYIVFVDDKCSMNKLFDLINEHSEVVEFFLLNHISLQLSNASLPGFNMSSQNPCSEIYLESNYEGPEEYKSTKNLMVLLNFMKSISHEYEY